MEAIHIRGEDLERRKIELEESLSELTGVDYEAERIKLREKILIEHGKAIDDKTQSP